MELKLLCKHFGTRKVLDEINLSIPRGEIFALVGPSGSGKSTLLKMVSGIQLPNSGEVWLNGKNVTQMPPYQRRVHTVFQNYALFPHLDVAGNVGFPLSVAGMKKSERQVKITRALGWVNLEDFGRRRIDKLSGGERQRVALARALVDDPECVLLDEPLSALDPHLRAQTLSLLQDIQERLNVTYIYVTHDREEALRAAHRVAILNHGRLEQVGTPKDVYHSPKTAFVASFVGPINWFDGQIERNGKQAVVRLPTGEPIPLDAQKLPLTDAVRLGVRPEDIFLGKDGILQAKIVSRQFAGAFIAVKLATKHGTFLQAEIRGDTMLPNTGEWVSVGWIPRQAHLFSPETPESRL